MEGFFDTDGINEYFTFDEPDHELAPITSKATNILFRQFSPLGQQLDKHQCIEPSTICVIGHFPKNRLTAKQRADYNDQAHGCGRTPDLSQKGKKELIDTKLKKN